MVDIADDVAVRSAVVDDDRPKSKPLRGAGSKPLSTSPWVPPRASQLPSREIVATERELWGIIGALLVTGPLTLVFGLLAVGGTPSLSVISGVFLLLFLIAVLRLLASRGG